MRFNARSIMARTVYVGQGQHLSKAGKSLAVGRALSGRRRTWREPMLRKLPAMRRKSRMFRRQWDRMFDAKHDDLFSVESALVAFAHIDADA